MNHASNTTIDGAGRLVLPKRIRELAGLEAGVPLTVSYRDGRIEIEPAPREIRIEERDGFRVAEPEGSYRSLQEGTVRATRDELRASRKVRKR